MTTMGAAGAEMMIDDDDDDHSWRSLSACSKYTYTFYGDDDGDDDGG